MYYNLKNSQKEFMNKSELQYSVVYHLCKLKNYTQQHFAFSWIVAYIFKLNKNELE